MQGSIRQKSADRWQVRVSLGRDPTTGRYRYIAREVRGTKRTAQRAAAELVNEVEHGLHGHRGPHTLAELIDRWMTHIDALGRSPSTRPATAPPSTRTSSPSSAPPGSTGSPAPTSTPSTPGSRSGASARSASASATPSSPPPSTRPSSGTGSTATPASAAPPLPRSALVKIIPPTPDELRILLDEAERGDSTSPPSSTSPSPPAPAGASCAACGGVTSTSSAPTPWWPDRSPMRPARWRLKTPRRTLSAGWPLTRPPWRCYERIGPAWSRGRRPQGCTWRRPPTCGPRTSPETARGAPTGSPAPSRSSPAGSACNESRSTPSDISRPQPWLDRASPSAPLPAGSGTPTPASPSAPTPTSSTSPTGTLPPPSAELSPGSCAPGHTRVGAGSARPIRGVCVHLVVIMGGDSKVEELVKCSGIRQYEA